MATAGHVEPAGYHTRRDERGRTVVVLTGQWTLRGIDGNADALASALREHARDNDKVVWDCREVRGLDNVGALVLWRLQGFAQGHAIEVRPEHAALCERWARREPPPEGGRSPGVRPLAVLSSLGQGLRSHALEFTTLIGCVVVDGGRLLRRPDQIPWKDISASIYEAGVRALGITALVGALVGIVMSYLSSLELRNFGAPSYIVNVLGLSIMRELGPLLAAILVAGRSGSAMAAELGVMRLTEELDALSAMGISRIVRLVLPNIVALAVALPLLVVWTDAIALFGGMVAAHITLGIDIPEFVHAIPSAVPVVDFVLGIVKGAVFGVVIALIACHFGLRIKPNTRSLGVETTNAVVTGISAVIFVDAVFAIGFRGIGLP
ncbi:ABC transporter permease [Acidiferrobacter sp.]|uniref:MlaE family ABC transporter permease n=1 Tax=Acidiferrobacter sp. TaxID=1872107 RepID=UPI002602854C|nr:ABC transporter permease [Acidiferrobacter sp.]